MTAETSGREQIVLAALLLAALLVRVHLATTREYIHDEVNTAIPLSRTISLDPDRFNLPLRGENHGAMPAYFVKVSSSLFGTSPIGYRAVHLIVGLMTVLLIYRLARAWYGWRAGMWAAALLAFNEYYLTISSRATAHVPHLFFATLAIVAFSRFLATERARFLYGAGVAVGLAFYCKEHSALLLPVFLVVLVRAKYRRWLRTPHPYLACAVVALLIAPDVLWNVRTDPAEARVEYSERPVAQATYRAHLQRIGGVGVSPYPAMFYAHDAVMSGYRAFTGAELRDETPEYRAMNAGIGLLLIAMVLLSMRRTWPEDDLRPFLLWLALGVFAFFTFIKKGNPPNRLDAVSWIWVEITILPAVTLAGARLASLRGHWGSGVWAVAAAALGYAIYAVIGLGR